MRLGASSGEAAMAKAVAEGFAKLADKPTQRADGMWIVKVRVTDPDSFAVEEVERGPWSTQRKAVDWISSILVGGYAPTQVARRGARHRSHDDEMNPQEGVGDLPGLQVQAIEYPSGRNGAPRNRVRIGAVRDTLEAYGLDPTAELARILTKETPRFRNGVPVIDADGNQVYEPALDDRTAAQILSDLQQYVTPKLKAVETMIRSDEPKTPEEVEAALQKLLDKRKALQQGAVR